MRLLVRTQQGLILLIIGNKVMYIYIWYLEKCSDNYHTDGGVVVVANNLTEAMDLAETRGCYFSEADSEPKVFKLSDDSVDTYINIFPNAGCC